MRMARHVAGVDERRDLRRVLVGRPEGNRQLGRPRRRWECIIRKWDVGVWTESIWFRIVTGGRHL